MSESPGLVLSPLNVSERVPEDATQLLADRLAEYRVRLCLADSDPDHNRTVLTLLGEPGALHQGLLHVFDWALARIDLAVHYGVHPRVGAVDVTPFVGVRNVDLEECVRLSRRFGREVSERHGVPVFLYAASAVDPWRASIASIRKGGLPGLAERMASGRDWIPDYGPPTLHPTAGAAIMGGRSPLIAFNVNLAVDDLESARAIARSIRESDGGAEGVMAIGVPLSSRGIAQVAMNLTRVTPGCLGEAFELVRAQAEALEVSVAGSELIGVAPGNALPEGGPESLRLENWSEDRVLEHHVRAWDADFAQGS